MHVDAHRSHAHDFTMAIDKHDNLQCGAMCVTPCLTIKLLSYCDGPSPERNYKRVVWIANKCYNHYKCCCMQS